VQKRVRLLEIDDAPVLAELQTRNRAFLAPYDPARPEVYYSLEGQQAEVVLALDRHSRGENLPLAILDDDGSVVGRVTLSGIVRGPFQSCSMGYWVDSAAGGRGFATSAASAAVDLAFTELGLHRVEAGTLTDNARSQRVLAKAGFERYGLAPAYLLIAGAWRDHVLFQRLNERAS
jgi:ribosomal-protein-alanine N-acetyltransferase